MISSTALFRVLTKGAQKRDTHFSKTEGDSVHEVTIKRTKGALKRVTQFRKTEGDYEHGPFPRVKKSNCGPTNQPTNREKTVLRKGSQKSAKQRVIPSTAPFPCPFLRVLWGGEGVYINKE